MTPSDYPSLLAVDTAGKLTEYTLSIITSDPDPESSNKPIKCVAKPEAMWELDRYVQDSCVFSMICFSFLI